MLGSGGDRVALGGSGDSRKRIDPELERNETSPPCTGGALRTAFLVVASNVGVVAACNCFRHVNGTEFRDRIVRRRAASRRDLERVGEGPAREQSILPIVEVTWDPNSEVEPPLGRCGRSLAVPTVVGRSTIRLGRFSYYSWQDSEY